jgi:hypothetical protein
MQALEKNATLRMLNLRGNDLTTAIAGDVAEMLLENNTLTQLNVVGVCLCLCLCLVCVVLSFHDMQV